MANSSVWHKTTMQTALESSTSHQQTYQTAALAGHKRSFEQIHQEGQGQHSRSKAVLQFRSASLSKQQARLSASVIRPIADHGNWGPGDYTQRQAISATPTSTVDPLLSLSHAIYKLPKELVDNCMSLGISTIYPWQKQCLLGPGLLQGEKSLVYTAPTGGGKSLVADILMLKRVTENHDAKALLVLPYVALVQEKVRWLRNLVQGISKITTNGSSAYPESPKLWCRRADEDTIRVVGFFGGSRLRATWHDFDVAVCTIEKVRSPL